MANFSYLITNSPVLFSHIVRVQYIISKGSLSLLIFKTHLRNPLNAHPEIQEERFDIPR